MAADPKHMTRIDEPTPHGGVASIAYWQDAEGKATTRDQAVAVEIVEIDAQGKQIYRTYGETIRATRTTS